jgi:hypothetical protein
VDSFGGGKDQGASQLAVVASLPLPLGSFFRSEITRRVQGVATRCLIVQPARGDALPRRTIPTRNFKGPRSAKG